jgi:hypothetical protein
VSTENKSFTSVSVSYSHTPILEIYQFIHEWAKKAIYVFRLLWPGDENARENIVDLITLVWWQIEVEKYHRSDLG